MFDKRAQAYRITWPIAQSRSRMDDTRAMMDAADPTRGYNGCVRRWIAGGLIRGIQSNSMPQRSFFMALSRDFQIGFRRSKSSMGFCTTRRLPGAPAAAFLLLHRLKKMMQNFVLAGRNASERNGGTPRP